MKTKMLLGATALLISAGTASATCGSHMYCDSSHLSAYEGSAYDMGDTVVHSSYSASSNYSSVASDAYADSVYGSGSISEAYTVPFTGGDVSHTGTISGLSITGLGPNEQLCPTACGTTGNPGDRVLGCYAVCKPAPKPVTYTTYTRVVRPIIYVRYPVPYAVPYQVPGSVHFSRYGDHGHARGYLPNCSYDYGYHGHAGGYGYSCR